MSINPTHPLTGAVRTDENIGRQLKLVNLNPSITFEWARELCWACGFDMNVRGACGWCGGPISIPRWRRK